LDEARTDGEQSETPADFRVSFESRRKPFEVLWREAAEAVERERLARKDDLYFIRAGSAVKIGHTINIVNRLGKMQADPGNLTLAAYVTNLEAQISRLAEVVQP
jgi:hypothetical protein